MTKQLSQHQARWSETLSKKLDIYLKKSFEVDCNAFNKCIVILPKHLNSVLLLNEEGLLNQICSASPNAYFKAKNPQTATNDLVAALHDSTPSSTTFTLSPNGKLLL
ncbi:hypothetical protein C0995_004792 [Termitomyces sp. Mi166|nr:hypothetical protein C0995_004792 [Termitomyces sp. Mi166\